MAFSWQSQARPIVALAPMAGVTDASYRQFIKQVAPEVVLYTEFLSTDAIHYGARKTMGMLHYDASLERPFIVQVFGKDPEHFLTAAKVIEQMGADGIDINMGCPAAKVVSSCHGSALIHNPDLAQRLVEATKKAVSIPVSVKTRLGWDTSETLITFCQKLVEAGADALAIHGRRYCDKFTGQARWDPIYELKRAVSVPVIGNGDIWTGQDAVEKIGNLDGVMVGRGTFGNPWLMADVVEALRVMRSPVTPQSSVAPNSFVETPRRSVETPQRGVSAGINGASTQNNTPIPTVQRLTFQEKIPFILQHCELAVRVKGEKCGMLEMRRHLASYVKGIEGASEMRAKLVRVESIAEVKAVLNA